MKKPRTAEPTAAKTRIVVKNEVASLTRDSRLLRRPNHLSELSTIDLRVNCISCRRLESSAESISQNRPDLLIKGNVLSARVADTLVLNLELRLLRSNDE